MINQLLRRKSVSKVLKDREEGLLDAEHHHTELKRTLTVRDLTAFGIAAIIGAGIFSTIGTASANGGPAISLLFVFTAIACGFSALCYAEFASMVPISGSAYTYAYVSFGELIAWIIGWDLLMEYAIGNIAVAISWSDYFTGFINHIEYHGKALFHFPEFLSTDYVSAKHGFEDAVKYKFNADYVNTEAYQAWIHAPAIGPLKLILDIPALFIVFVVTYLVYVGIKESRNASNIMVLIKLIVVVLVIGIGAFYVNTSNWSPFAPNGISGVLMGVSSVFFAYIGFDAISTTAEECKNPQRDLPRGMFYSLIICTVLYVAVALVLTGMVSYKELGVGDPLSFVFQRINLKFIGGVVAISAIIATTSVLLVFQIGQPRIWMSMSRDGLLPPIFARIHPKYKTPSFSTVVTGFLVAVPALFLNLKEVVALTSIGTLFAFVLVNGGVLMLQNNKSIPERKFKIPYVNGKWIVPVVVILIGVFAFKYFPDTTNDFLHSQKLKEQSAFVDDMKQEDISKIKTAITAQLGTTMNDRMDKDSVKKFIADMNMLDYEKVVRNADVPETTKFYTGIDGFGHQVTSWLFVMLCLFIALASVIRNLSLIPVLGLLTCFYLMTQEGPTNWARFVIWLFVGLVIYFFYGYKNSKIAKDQSPT